MIAIINNKLYDTEKAEKIIEFRRRVNEGEIMNSGMCYVPFHNFSLYKTAKDNYFEYDEKANKINPISESTAKNIIRETYPDIYIKLFGEVEEA